MEDLVRFLNILVTLYVLAIFAYIITSWIRLPYSLRPAERFLYDLCEPYLSLWRRFVPLQFGPIDLTPMVAVFALLIGWRLLASVLI